MGEQRSLIGHLTLTAWESWAAESHWRNAVIIALVGAIAFTIAKVPQSAPQASAPTQNAASTATPYSTNNTTQAVATMQQSVQNGSATLITPTSKAPLKLKPKIPTEDVIINETENTTPTASDSFGRSYGDE